jgi:hypothetical protein
MNQIVTVQTSNGFTKTIHCSSGKVKATKEANGIYIEKESYGNGYSEVINLTPFFFMKKNNSAPVAQQIDNFMLDNSF